MRISRRKRRPQSPVQKFKINEWIKAPRLKVVDDEGNFLGIMEREEALRKARELEMDLIEIVPKGDMPVAKITEYGKFKYQKEKEVKKQKAQQKKTEIKGIRLSVRIGRHDIDLRLKRAKKFLESRDKIKVELILKGREKGKPEQAREVIKNFIEELNAEIPVKTEQPISRQGGKFFAVIAPN